MSETKHWATNLVTSFGAVGPAGYVSQAFLPAEGAQGGQRIGRRVEVTGFKLFGVLAGGQSNLATDDRTNQFRIWVVLADGSQSGVGVNTWFPALTTITDPIRLKDPVLPSTGGTMYLRRILKDKTYVLCSPGRDSTGYMPVQRKVYIRLRFKRPIIIDFGDETATKPQQFLSVVMVSDSAAAPSPGFVSGNMQWFYKDI